MSLTLHRVVSDLQRFARLEVNQALTPGYRDQRDPHRDPGQRNQSANQSAMYGSFQPG